MVKGLCATCTNGIRCPTWAEWRCKAKEKRIYNADKLTKCESYKKRDKNFKEPKCQCRSCLENEKLWEYYDEGIADELRKH